MRLCTSDELTSDEAKQTGCRLDASRVWSADACGDFGQDIISQAGASDYLGVAPANCTSKSSLQGVRCCADVANVCTGECQTDQDSGNVCIPLPEDHFMCTCNSATGWVETDYGHACAREQCATDVCNQDIPGNVCTSHPDGKYHCTCGAPGWAGDSLSQSCFQYTARCQEDECSSSLDGLNKCVDDRLGGHTCVCAGFRFVETADRRGCAVLRAACTTGAECQADVNPNNTCVDRGLVDDHHCTPRTHPTKITSSLKPQLHAVERAQHSY
jgi:hypothetical protein